MLEEVRSENAVVGMRRCMRLIESGNALKAFIAGDVEPNMTKKILDACRSKGVAIELVESKAALGKACHIDVDASVVVISK